MSIQLRKNSTGNNRHIFSYRGKQVAEIVGIDGGMYHIHLAPEILNIRRDMTNWPPVVRGFEPAQFAVMAAASEAQNMGVI